MRVVVAALAVLVAREAYAGSSCGGGGGGGSSSSDSSDNSSSSSSSSDSGSTAAPPCIDDTDVVGYKRCTAFGQRWGIHPRVPRVFLELGTNMRQFSSGVTSPRESTVAHGSENFTYRMVTPPESTAGAAAVTSNVRLGIGLPRGMYAGIEGELGGLTSAPTSIGMAEVGIFGAPEVTQRTAILVGGGGFVGTRIARGRASLAIEGAGGVRNVTYRATSTYHNCVDTASFSVTQGVLEARARAELWVNPWFSVGAQAGANVVAKGDWMTGLFIGVHNRAFGGR